AVAAVVGRAEIMEGCERSRPGKMRVHFEGGTFSAHEESMRAGLAMLEYLSQNEDNLFPYIGNLAENLRKGIEKVFQAEGLETVCTGYPEGPVQHSSFFMVNFPKKKLSYRSPEDVWNPDRSEVFLREEALKLALLLNGVHVVHGGGCLSAAHTPEDVAKTIQAYAEAARIFKKYL
ncbi:MAG: hypothetical protein ACPLRA_05375, partial [Candidatus Saccharicenans sp.]